MKWLHIREQEPHHWMQFTVTPRIIYHLDTFLVDITGMSTRLGLFYAFRLRNRVYCTLIFTFLCCCVSIYLFIYLSFFFSFFLFFFLFFFFFFFFFLAYRIRTIFKQIYLTYRWESNRYYHSESKRTWE